MKNIKYILSFFLICIFLEVKVCAQTGNGAPYCVGTYNVASAGCAQPGPSNSPGNSINDFINSFNTTGANSDICNNNSGCTNLPNNYTYYNTSNQMVASPGQTITCNLQSGNIYSQGFAIFIDWNNNGVFDFPSEQVAGTIGVPTAGTFTQLTFVIPPGQPLGTYRLRVRCQFATPGLYTGPNTGITPCNVQPYGETEDYDITLVGSNNIGNALTATLVSNSPVCAGQTLSITALTSATVSYIGWSGPSSFSTTGQSAVLPNAQTNMSGVYTATIGSGGCPVTKTVSVKVVGYPGYAVAPNSATVCQGGSFLAVCNVVGQPNDFFYSWSGSGTSFQNPSGLSTLVNLLPVNTVTALVVYSIVVTPTILNCPVTQTMSVLVNNPPTPTLSLPGQLCNTFPNTFATAIPPGGTWYGNPVVASNGVVIPVNALANNLWGCQPVSYSITVGSCTAHATGNICVSQFNSAALTGTIPNMCVSDLPFNLLSIVQNPSGLWSGVATSANTFTAYGIPTGVYVLTYYNPSSPNPNICPASSTMAVTVFNPPTPNITPIQPKCTNASSVALLASPSGGVWSGNSGISANGIYTPGASLNTAGTNTVIYTAGQGSCVASSSATFQVSQFKSASLATYSLNICVTTNPIDLMTLVTGAPDGTWNGDVTGTYSFVPNTNSVTGVYTCTYHTLSFPNDSLCPDSSVLSISMLNPIQPTITAIGPFCSADAPFQLSVSPNTGSFIPSPYLSGSGLFTPGLSALGNNVVQYIIGTNTCNVTDSKLISVEAFVPPTITGSIPDQCNTAPSINLGPLTANNLGRWSGPGVIGTSFNPVFSGVGVLSLVYSTASSPSSLCPAQQILPVTVYSLATPVISLAGPFCNSAPPIKLQATPVGGVFGNNTPAIDMLGWFNPAFANIGDNTINYTVTAGPCVAYAQSIIQIEKFISADLLKYIGPFCKNDPPIDLSSAVQNPGGTWAGPGITGSIFTPANANPGDNNIILYQTQSQTPELCPDTSYMRIKINDIPNVSIQRDVTQGCAPVEVVFTTANTSGRGEWFLGDGTQFEGLSVSHSFTASGTYSVVFNYWDEIGCSNQAFIDKAVTVFEVPRAAFTYEPYEEVTIANPDVQFINQTQSIGKSTYQWQIADLYSVPDVNPMAILPKAGEYRITLTATTQDGCIDQTSQNIIVKPDFNVFIPNSFTPNYDGINDTFSPVFSSFGLDPKTYELEIFDRWGVSLYYTKDINKGWDGSLQNKGSDALKQEVYVYKVKYKDLEGKIYNKLGYVTLIR